MLALAAASASAQSRRRAPAPAPAAARRRRRAAGRPCRAAPVSLSARKVYEQARSQLVQIRTVLKGQASQTSVGSGFLVTSEGHIVTNFHVVSEAALKPERHDLVYVTADGREAPLHDPAARRAARPGAAASAARRRRRRQPSTRCAFRPEDAAAGAGRAHLLARQPARRRLRGRRRAPTTAWSSAASIRRSSSAARSRRGMSGGPALDEEGHVVGINVARRVDGEQVSFLVPAELRDRAAGARHATRRRSPRPAYDDRRRAAAEAPGAAHRALHRSRAGRARPIRATCVPVPPDVFMRCWGSSEPSRTGGLDFERSDCVMDTRIFVGEFTTGTISLRHESYDGSKLGALRFASRYSQSFRNEAFMRLSAQHQTKPRCNEDFIDRDGLPLRAVVCMRAYKKLPQLYDVVGAGRDARPDRSRACRAASTRRA